MHLGAFSINVCAVRRSWKYVTSAPDRHSNIDFLLPGVAQGMFALNYKTMAK